MVIQQTKEFSHFGTVFHFPSFSLWLLNIAMENGHLVNDQHDDSPKRGDFPVRKLYNFTRNLDADWCWFTYKNKPGDFP